MDASVGPTQTVVEHPAKFFPDFEDASVTAIKRVTAQRLTESNKCRTFTSRSRSPGSHDEDRKTLNDQLANDKSAEGKDYGTISSSRRARKRLGGARQTLLPGDKSVHKKADISVAVQTERRLMCPSLLGCCPRLKSISSEVKALAGRARDGTLTLHDMTGGTFTISNLGMFGVKSFTTIVNPPLAAILCMVGLRKEVVKNFGRRLRRSLAPSATLSCDHRVGTAPAAQWLQSFKGYRGSMTMLL